MKSTRSNAVIILLMFIVILTDCSKSSDPETPILLEGTWMLTSATASECNNSGSNGSNESIICPPSEDGQECINYAFTSDNLFAVTILIHYNGSLSEGTSSGTYSLVGHKLTMTTTLNSAGGAPTTLTADVGVSGNVLTMKISKNTLNGCRNTFTLIKQ
jgi:hypothetical protein